jgi:arsenate reductase
MSEITIYHNPNCSKSRQTLELLRERGVEPKIIHYLETPPDEETLRQLLQLMEMEPLDLVRKKEDLFQELAIEKMLPDSQQLVRIMVENPILIERPIVVKGNRAVIGRPPDSVLTLIDDK